MSVTSFSLIAIEPIMFPLVYLFDKFRQCGTSFRPGQRHSELDIDMIVRKLGSLLLRLGDATVNVVDNLDN